MGMERTRGRNENMREMLGFPEMWAALVRAEIVLYVRKVLSEGFTTKFNFIGICYVQLLPLKG
jgi:hypothetical protein